MNCIRSLYAKARDSKEAAASDPTWYDRLINEPPRPEVAICNDPKCKSPKSTIVVQDSPSKSQKSPKVSARLPPRKVKIREITPPRRLKPFARAKSITIQTQSLNTAKDDTITQLSHRAAMTLETNEEKGATGPLTFRTGTFRPKESGRQSSRRSGQSLEKQREKASTMQSTQRIRALIERNAR